MSRVEREAHVEDDVRRRLVRVRDSILSEQRDRDTLHVLDDLRPPFLESDLGSVGVVLSVEGSYNGDDGRRYVGVSSASNGRVGDLRRDETRRTKRSQFLEGGEERRG